MENRPIVLILMALLICTEPVTGNAADEIDLLIQHGKVPPGMIRGHGYSDFTDPLGRFLDLLAAGAFVEAKAIEPDACVAWRTTRQNSPLSGTFWVWDTEMNLDRLCAAH